MEEMMGKVKVYYFSPTGGTWQVAQRLGDRLGALLGAAVEYHSYTLPREREALPQVGAGDVVVWATPVYAGRIPNKTLDYVRRAIHADGNPAIALVAFGNRAYDNALAELVGLMEEGGMKPVGAAAMVTHHAFSDILGTGRPNEEDLAALDRFAVQVAEKLLTHNSKLITVSVPGEAHPEKYYTPLNINNAPAGFLKAKPLCNSELCTRCGVCLEVCPMGSIGAKDGMPTFDGICIKCQACRRHCPTGAIAFTDPEYLSHVAMIERTFAVPKQAEFFVARNVQLRPIEIMEIPLLDDFLYEAIFIPEGVPAPPRSIIDNEELQVYVKDFGKRPDDRCLVAECDGKVVGAVWTRIMDDYGHVADDTPSLAMSLYREYRNRGIGTALLERMLELLRNDGYKQVSLSVQKANYAVRMYRKVGFVMEKETEEEYTMVCNLQKEE